MAHRTAAQIRRRSADMRSDRLAQVPRPAPRTGFRMDAATFWLLTPGCWLLLAQTRENREHLIRRRRSERIQNHWAEQGHAAGHQARSCPAPRIDPLFQNESGEKVSNTSVAAEAGTAKLRSADSSSVMNAKNEIAMKTDRQDQKLLSRQRRQNPADAARMEIRESRRAASFPGFAADRPSRCCRRSAPARTQAFTARLRACGLPTPTSIVPATISRVPAQRAA